MKVYRALGAAVALTVASMACTVTPSTPTSASASPFDVAVDGLYTGDLVLSDVAGGECVGLDLSRSLGAADEATISIITQEASQVTATVRSSTTGLSCTYSGDTRSANLAVSDSSCNEEILFQCADGNSRVIVPVGSTMTASIVGATASGTVAASFNVYSEVAGTRIPVAGLTTQERFDATRR
jgi:hypothetical protein